MPSEVEQPAEETVRQLRLLATPEGTAALARAAALLADRTDVVAALTRLRAEFGADLGGPAWGVARQRARARPAFGADADRLLFTGDTLEQAGRPGWPPAAPPGCWPAGPPPRSTWAAPRAPTPSRWPARARRWSPSTATRWPGS